MAALQRGWERGRSASGMLPPEVPPAPDPALDTEPATGELTPDETDE
jgi:hypothetical protein